MSHSSMKKIYAERIMLCECRSMLCCKILTSHRRSSAVRDGKKGKEEIFADNFFSILQNLKEIGREIEVKEKITRETF